MTGRTAGRDAGAGEGTLSTKARQERALAAYRVWSRTSGLNLPGCLIPYVDGWVAGYEAAQAAAARED